MPNGSDRITSHPLQELQPTKSIEDDQEIKAWLSLATKTKKKGGGKKKKGIVSDNPFCFLIFVFENELLKLNACAFSVQQARKGTPWKLNVQMAPQMVPPIRMHLKHKESSLSFLFPFPFWLSNIYIP